MGEINHELFKCRYVYNLYTYFNILYDVNRFVYLGFAAIGTARLLNIYPFNVTHKSFIKKAER